MNDNNTYGSWIVADKKLKDVLEAMLKWPDEVLQRPAPFTIKCVHKPPIAGEVPSLGGRAFTSFKVEFHEQQGT